MTIAVGLAVAASAVHLAWLGGDPPPLSRHATSIAVLAVLFAAAEKFVVTFPVRRGSHTISLSEIPLVLGLAMIDPASLLTARIAGGVAGLTIFRSQRGVKLAFNLALYATQVTVATAVFELVAVGAPPLGPVGWLAVYAGTLAADVVSIALVTAVIALHDDAGEWRRLLTADIKNLLQLPLVVVTTTLALVAALIIRDEILASVLLGILCYAIYRVFSRYSQQTQTHTQIEQMYDFARSLDGYQDLRHVAHTVLSRLRDM